MPRTAHAEPSCRRAFTALLAALLFAGLSAPVGASDTGSSDESATTEPEADKAVVVPYETRPSPSHRVDLRDDRVYFLKKLEQNGDTYVLHTLEDEVIEVEASNIARIVEFKRE